MYNKAGKVPLVEELEDPPESTEQISAVEKRESKQKHQEPDLVHAARNMRNPLGLVYWLASSREGIANSRTRLNVLHLHCSNSVTYTTPCLGMALSGCYHASLSQCLRLTWYIPGGINSMSDASPYGRTNRSRHHALGYARLHVTHRKCLVFYYSKSSTTVRSSR